MTAIGLIVGLLVLPPGTGRAEEPSVEDVLRQVRAQDDVIDDQTADLNITSVDAAGVERATTLGLFWRNPRGAKGLVGQTLLVTREPKNRKGESFLLWQNSRTGSSQAWVYVPDLRQALRVTIAAQDAQRPGATGDMLLGFEQLGARLLDDADRVIAGREELDGVDFLVVDERLSAAPTAIRRFWVSPSNWTIAKIEYREAGRVERTQTIEWQQIGRAWIWKRVEVRTANPPRRTVVELRNASVNTGLSERSFSVNTLKSGALP